MERVDELLLCTNRLPNLLLKSSSIVLTLQFNPLHVLVKVLKTAIF